MLLNISTPVKIDKGLGYFDFPDALKRESLHTYIGCQSLFHQANKTASDRALLIVCSGSFYLNKTRQMTNNVLAMFQDSKTSKLVQFNRVEKIRVNLPQEVLQIQIVDIDGNVQNINGLAVVDICGKVSDRLAAI